MSNYRILIVISRGKTDENQIHEIVSHRIQGCMTPKIALENRPVFILKCDTALVVVYIIESSEIRKFS